MGKTPALIHTRGDVYWNLHKKCWSFRDLKTRKVVLHAKSLTLQAAEFHVSESGRQRVLREKRKNVHAVVRGTLVAYTALDGTHVNDRTRFRDESVTDVTYNPYKYETFVVRGTEQPVKSAHWVRFEERRCMVDVWEPAA